MTAKSPGRSAAVRTVVYPVTFFVLVSAVLLVIYARSLLIPLAIAILVWFLLNAIMTAIGRITVGSWRPPQWLRLILSLVIVTAGVVFMVEVVSGTISAMSAKLPAYQENLQRLLTGLGKAVGMDQIPITADILKEIDFAKWLGSLLGALSNLTGQAGIIFIYIIFLLLEQRSFDRKIDVLFPDAGRQGKVRDLLEQMATKIRT